MGSETELKVKKIVCEYLKIDPKLIEFYRAHRCRKYDQSGRASSVVIELLRYEDKQEKKKLKSYTSKYLNVSPFKTDMNLILRF